MRMYGRFCTLPHAEGQLQRPTQLGDHVDEVDRALPQVCPLGERQAPHHVLGTTGWARAQHGHDKVGGPLIAPRGPAISGISLLRRLPPHAVKRMLFPILSVGLATAHERMVCEQHVMGLLTPPRHYEREIGRQCRQCGEANLCPKP